jgi:hypothetical protein
MSAATIAGIVVVVAVVVLVISMMMAARRRRLQRRFGQEYDRVVQEKQSHRKAETELAGRERRVQHLDIRPLAPEAQVRYAAEWADVQERFVDQPQQAVTEAQRLVVAVRSERGYPAEGHDQIAADLSVEHAPVLAHYRIAEDISRTAAAGDASTEDLRQAMIHYRVLFGALLGEADEAGPGVPGTPPAATVPAGTPSARPPATVPPAQRPAPDGTGPSELDDLRPSNGEAGS